MAPGLAPRRLRILRALEADGVCASVLFGLPFVVRPTNCWQLSWDELETNQQNFQAFCHCLRVSPKGKGGEQAGVGGSSGFPEGRPAILPAVCWLHLSCSPGRSIPLLWHAAQRTLVVFQKRKWLLLAKYETWGRPDLSGGLSAGSFQVLLPSDSCALLLRPLVARELLLPCSFPPLPADLPEVALTKMEGILGSLEFEASYNPLRATSYLYQALKRYLGRLPATRVQRWAPRQWPRQVPRGT
uniref:Uncharacterized protein n=1 Tax=Laticauda laticaudata TaxID=8630 RepID=A0A8C5SR36_LATLA